MNNTVTKACLSFAGAVLWTVSAGAANVWHVSAANDGGAVRDGSAAHPYGTIQEAINADATLANDTILVAPGVYSNGCEEVSGIRYRVNVTKTGLVIRSSERHGAQIVGVRPDGGADESVACVCLNAGKGTVCFEGFVLRDGNSSGSATTAGGAAVGANNSSSLGDAKKQAMQFVDCVITNNASKGNLAYFATLHRCLVADNVLGTTGATVYGCHLSNCLLTRNVSGYMAQYSVAANCTIAGNAGAAIQASSTSHKVYNCILALNSVNGDGAKKAEMKHTVTTAAAKDIAATFTDGRDGVSATELFFAPLFDDYRLLVGSPAREVSAPVTDCTDLIAAPYDGYVWRDFDGNPLPDSGTVLPGAFQGGAPVPASGAYVIGDVCSRTADAPCPVIEGIYAYAAAWPTQWCVRAVDPDTKPLAFVLDTIASVRRFSGYDECVWMMPPPVGTNKTATAVCAQAIRYVNKATGNDDWDGTSPSRAPDADPTSKSGPKRTLQGAVDGLPAYLQTRVYVAPGVYDEGFENGGGAYSNRVAIASSRQRPHFVATDGPEATVIMGASDDKGEETAKGCALRGMRCVYSYSDYVGFRGFTFTGGRTAFGSGSSYAGEGAVWYSNCRGAITDSIISNNVGYGSCLSGQLTLERCIVRKNETLIADGAITRVDIGYFSACLFAENQAHSVLGGSAHVACGCVFDGSSGVSCVAHSKLPSSFFNTVFYACGATPFQSAATVLSGCLMDGTTTTYDIPCATGSARFVDPGSCDYHLSPGSAAKGIARCGETFADQVIYSALAGTDIDGNPSALAGPVYAGAYAFGQRDVIFVSDEDGRLVLTGCRVGATVLASGSQVTIALNKSGRPCPGINVNGVFRSFASGPISFTHDEVTAAGGLSVEAVSADVWYVDARNGSDATGDGFTAGTAFFTLTNALAHAISGDTVYAAPGVYSNGTVEVKGKGVFRAAVPTGVTLAASSGRPDETFVLGASAQAEDALADGRGSDAVRCVYIGSSAAICGFTITGGRSGSGKDSLRDSAAIRGDSYDTSAVIGCVISNNVADMDLIYAAKLVKCQVLENKTETDGICRNTRVYGSLIARNRSGSSPMKYTLSFENSTFAADNVNLNGQSYATMPEKLAFMPTEANRTMVNSVVCGAVSAKLSISNCVFVTGCVPADVVDRYLVREVTAAELALDATTDYRPHVSVSRALDAGDLTMVDTNLCGVTDLADAPRVMNGKMDCGCYEADWRPRYAQAIGRGVTVTDVTSDVVLRENGHVFVPAGASIGFDWSGGRANRAATWQLELNVAGFGTCVALRNDTELLRTSAPGIALAAFDVEGLSVEHIRLTYEVGVSARASDGAEIIHARIPCGLVLIVR